MKTIFDETQQQRDIELSELLSVDLEVIKKGGICVPNSIRVFGGDEKPTTEDEYLSLYSEYSYLDFPSYLKTLMSTSVNRRGHYFTPLDVSGKHCLDFGSGVGTHAIYLLSRGNTVDILDVDGPLLDFAHERISKRGYHCEKFVHDQELQDDCYDLVVCLDVLEHVFDPSLEIARLHKSLKVGGILLLEVSSMVKDSSGHFAESIKKWRIAGVKYLQDNFVSLGKGMYKK